ncbi:MAG TPA: chemotaxis protein CheW [bacterium]
MSEPNKSNPSVSQLICFKLGQEEFGVDILKVKEIVPVQTIAQLPQTSDTVSGIINLRGDLVPVINLRVKFGLEEIPRDDKTRIIVFFVSGKLIGMMVDRVERVLRLKDNPIEPVPDIGVGKIQEYVIGLTKVERSLIIQINIDKILTDEEIVRLEDIVKMKEAYETRAVA